MYAWAFLFIIMFFFCKKTLERPVYLFCDKKNYLTRDKTRVK